MRTLSSGYSDIQRSGRDGVSRKQQGVASEVGETSGEENT